MATPTSPLTVAAAFPWTTGAASYAQPVPPAPQNLNATPVGTTQVTVGLPSPDVAATNTEWSYKLTSSGSWIVWATTAAAITTQSITSLAASTSYDFRARYQGLNGYSAYSNTATVTITPPAAVPSLNTPTVISATQINVSLTVFPLNAVSVVVQRSIDPTFVTSVVTVATLTSPTLTCSDTGLLAGVTYYYRAYSINTAGSSAFSSLVSGSTTGSGSGQLPAGHWLPQKMAMTAILPRPDSETGTYGGGTFAKHRWAYYDGVNSVRYEVPVKIQGGARPLVYTLVAGPSGASIGQTYGTANYGVVTWVPNAVVSTGAPVTFTVRARGQDGNTIDMTWTTATSQSTAQFVFIAPGGNDSTGNGTITTPFATLQKVMGATSGTTTYPGAAVYMRNGSYATVEHSAGTGYVNINRALQPISYLCYPGETAVISVTGAEIHDNGFTDLFFAGSTTSRLSINGSSANAAETHTFWNFSASRTGFSWVDFTNPVSRVAGNFTNSTSIFASKSGAKQYCAIHNCTESGRVTNGNNDMLLYCLFQLDYIVVEFCSVPSGTALFGPFMKDTNSFVTVAHNSWQGTVSGGNGLLFGTQNGGANLEACYNFVNNSGGLKLNFQGNSGAGQQWSYRNTIIRTDTNEPYGVLQNGGIGPYSSENDVVIAKGPTLIGPSVTASGTEAQTAWNGQTPPGINIPVSATTGALVNVSGGTQYRTLYLGTRGWEIA